MQTLLIFYFNNAGKRSTDHCDLIWSILILVHKYSLGEWQKWSNISTCKVYAVWSNISTNKRKGPLQLDLFCFIKTLNLLINHFDYIIMVHKQHTLEISALYGLPVPKSIFPLSRYDSIGVRERGGACKKGDHVSLTESPIVKAR